MPSIWSIIYHEVTNTAPQGRGDVDTKSCIVLLMDLFTQWLNGDQLSHVIITEIIKSVSYYQEYIIYSCIVTSYITATGCLHI